MSNQPRWTGGGTRRPIRSTRGRLLRQLVPPKCWTASCTKYCGLGLASGQAARYCLRHKESWVHRHMKNLAHAPLGKGGSIRRRDTHRFGSQSTAALWHRSRAPRCSPEWPQTPKTPTPRRGAVESKLCRESSCLGSTPRPCSSASRPIAPVEECPAVPCPRFHFVERPAQPTSPQFTLHAGEQSTPKLMCARAASPS